MQALLSHHLSASLPMSKPKELLLPLTWTILDDLTNRKKHGTSRILHSVILEEALSSKGRRNNFPQLLDSVGLLTDSKGVVHVLQIDKVAAILENDNEFDPTHTHIT